MKNIKYYKNLDEFINDNKDSSKELFLLVAENCDFSIKKLQETNIKFSGGIFPQIILNNQNYDKGLLSAELEEGTNSFLIKDLENFELHTEDLNDADSISIIIDGLSKKTTTFLESIFKVLPLNCEIIGGGSGKLTLKQEPVVFSNEGIFQDAAILLAINSRLFVGVENGWEYLEGPFIATSTDKNVVHSLNFENAFEVYKKVVEKDSGLKFNDENFFDIAKSYPLGIVKYDKEVVVRDPITKDESGSLILVGDLEQNSTINVLKGNKESLVSSSGNAILNAIEKKSQSCNTACSLDSIILFDCISRKIFLDSHFKEELSEIKKHIPTKDLFGALPLGEIANTGDEYINFYNKTCVLGILC